MTFDNYKQKPGVVVVFTGEGKGKTSAGLGLMARALGAGHKVAFIQFMKLWDVSEHRFIRDIASIYGDNLTFYKGGLGFYNAQELSSSATEEEHRKEARQTYEFAYKVATSGEYNLVVCDEINNAVYDGLLERSDLEKLLDNKKLETSLCLTGRYFPTELIGKVDIATEMKKLKHHFDDGIIASKGIDY